MSPRRRLWWSGGRLRAFRRSSYGLSFRVGASFVVRHWICSISFVSFRVWCSDNISVFEVRADHCYEQCWNGCYIQASKCFLD